MCLELGVAKIMADFRSPWSFLLLLSSSIKLSLGEIPYAPRGIGGLSDFGGDVSQYMSLLKGDDDVEKSFNYDMKFC